MSLSLWGIPMRFTHNVRDLQPIQNRKRRSVSRMIRCNGVTAICWVCIALWVSREQCASRLVSRAHSTRVLDPLVRHPSCPLPRADAVERGVRLQLPLRVRVHHAGCSESMIRRAKQRMHVQASALTMT